MVLVIACAIGIGSFVVSFLSGIMAIKIVSFALEAGSTIENCTLLTRFDYALTRIVTDVLPDTVSYIEQFLPAIIIPGHDEDWPIFLRYPFFGMYSVFIIVFVIFLTLLGIRAVSDAVERRNESEARRMQAEAERRKAAVAG